MPLPRVLLGVLVCFTIVGGLLIAQEAKQDPPPKLKGMLPPNYGKLGLSEEQKQAIFKADAEFDAKIADAEAKIKQLKNDKRQAIEKVLTAQQKEQLKKILLGEK